jgi:N-acetylneuraminate synthase
MSDGLDVVRHARVFDIGRRRVGPGEPTFVVAEMSANHGGSLEHAIRVLHAAKESGADAVKIQTYTADTMTLDLERAPFIVKLDAWSGRSLHELYREAHTPWGWHATLKRVADEIGIPLFSSPFDATAVDLLETLNVPAYKIASFELVDHELLRLVARTGKPVILSTGMARLDEIVEAVAVLRAANPGVRLMLLKCTSVYPADPREANLRTIPHLAETFDCASGISDHTLAPAVAIAAVALGASMIEKHFCLSRADGGPDASFSLEPGEFRALVRDVRLTEAALGRVNYEPSPSEERSRAYRRSLFVVEDVAKGEPFTRANVRAIRPGDGLAPKYLPEALGRRAAGPIARGTPLAWSHLGTRLE